MAAPREPRHNLAPARRVRRAAAPREVPPDRADLLADVAEMYYLDNKNQYEIARVVGVTRSMVSRMLSEARERGIVEINIRRQLQLNRELEARLVDCFGLRSAHVVKVGAADDHHRLLRLGMLAAEVLQPLLANASVMGLAWGSAVSATVDALRSDQHLPLKVVQLVGSLGARNDEYDGRGLVARLVEKTGGEGYYLNAPFICPSADMVASLLQTQGIQETVRLNSHVEVLLAGIGTTAPEFSSIYLAGYLPLAELERLRATGAVGDVCGLHFDRHGQPCSAELTERFVTIRREHLLAIPVRVGVAGGPGKVETILGALRSGYVNILVTDHLTAEQVLDLVPNWAGPDPLAAGTDNA